MIRVPQDHGRVVDFLQACWVFGSLSEMILARASIAFPHSSWASSIDFPVAIDCAETARIPVASSSVRLAWKTRSAVPYCSISFLIRDGPSPGVSDNANQYHPCSEAGCGTAMATFEISRDRSVRRKGLSRMARTSFLVEFVN